MKRLLKETTIHTLSLLRSERHNATHLTFSSSYLKSSVPSLFFLENKVNFQLQGLMLLMMFLCCSFLFDECNTTSFLYIVNFFFLVSDMEFANYCLSVRPITQYQDSFPAQQDRWRMIRDSRTLSSHADPTLCRTLKSNATTTKIIAKSSQYF